MENIQGEEKGTSDGQKIVVRAELSKDQLDKLVGALVPEHKSGWAYWKDKLILPLALTFGGVLLTSFFGFLQARQAQRNYENSENLAKVQTREKYIAYFQQSSTIAQKLSALSTLIDLDANDLAADLLVSGALDDKRTGDSGKQDSSKQDSGEQDSSSKSQIDHFILTNGKKLIPRLCYLASDSDWALEELRPSGDHFDYNSRPQPSDLALQYAGQLAEHPREQEIIKEMAFKAPEPNEELPQTQARDGAVLVMAHLVRRRGWMQKPPFDRAELETDLKGVLKSERSETAKLAALVALAPKSSEDPLLDVFEDNKQDVFLRASAFQALFNGDLPASDKANQQAYQVFQDPKTPPGIRCDIFQNQPRKFHDALASLLQSKETADRNFAAGCLAEAGSVAVDSLAPILVGVMEGEKDMAVKKNLIEALSQSGSPEAIRALETAAKDGDPTIRSSAYEALFDMAGRSGPILLQALDDPDPRVVGEIVNDLKAPNQTARKVAEQRIAKMPDSDNKDKWMHALRSDDMEEAERKDAERRRRTTRAKDDQ